MVATDFLHDPQVRKWLDGVEPAWTLLTFDSLRALRQEPSASQAAIRIANDLSADEIAGSALARNTCTLPRPARLLAAGGHRHCAVVASGFRRRLANRREADAAMYHPGSCHSVGDMGQVDLRHGGQNPAASVVVWSAGVPQ